MTDAHPAAGVQRLAALVILLVAGIVSLPIAAAILDGGDTENFILPAQFLCMALIGALVGYLLPGLAGPGASTRQSVWVGVGVALLMAVLALLVFGLLLNGV